MYRTLMRMKNFAVLVAHVNQRWAAFKSPNDSDKNESSAFQYFTSMKDSLNDYTKKDLELLYEFIVLNFSVYSSLGLGYFRSLWVFWR